MRTLREVLWKMIAATVTLVAILITVQFWLGTGFAPQAYERNDPYPGLLTTGTQVSSTYEGRHVTVLESNLLYYDYDGDGLVEKGDPVLVGISGDRYTSGMVGVAFRSAAAATEYVAIDTEGIWNLPVFTTATIHVGQRIFISNRTGQLSTSHTLPLGAVGTTHTHTAMTWLPFGWALNYVNPVTSTTYVVPIKVHSD